MVIYIIYNDYNFDVALVKILFCNIEIQNPDRVKSYQLLLGQTSSHREYAKQTKAPVTISTYLLSRRVHKID